MAALLEAPGALCTCLGPAFALGRVTLDEAELLTIACPPDAQRLGHGRATLAAFEAEAKARCAASVFLEVAEDNPAACALYAASGYEEIARRRGYYTRTTGGKVTALIYQKRL